MEYLALIYADEGVWERHPAAEREARTSSTPSSRGPRGDAGVLVGGDELGSTSSATTVRVRDGSRS